MVVKTNSSRSSTTTTTTTTTRRKHPPTKIATTTTTTVSGRLSHWLRFWSKMTQSCEQQQQQDNNYKRNHSSTSHNSSNSSASSGGRRAAQTQQRRMSSSRQQQRQRDDDDVSAYVPPYLKRLVYPYHGEYCYTPIFKAHFIAQLMAEGFLPVATRGMLLPKLHQQRSVVTLPHGLHVSKSVRKKSKRFSITINTRFDQVIQGCHDQHGSHCWLYPPLVAAFREMFGNGNVNNNTTKAFPIGEATGRPIPGREWPVRLYTVEVWNETTGELAGGELGYSVGSIYTSLTGFTKEDSAGSVQLAALGRLLCEKGFELWDMGMHMEYKSSIGAELMPRETFLSQVHRVRETHGHLVLPCKQSAQNCKDVIDRNNPEPPQTQQPNKQTTAKLPNKDGNMESLPQHNEQVHTPPQSEAEAPIKKRARKPGVD